MYRTHAHNIYLNAAAETGLPGLVAMLLITLLPLWDAWRLYRARTPHLWGLFPALAGMLAHQQVDIPVVSAAIGGGFWALAGIAVAFWLLRWPAAEWPTTGWPAAKSAGGQGGEAAAGPPVPPA